MIEPLPKLDPATGLYICNYCHEPGCPGVFNRLACNHWEARMSSQNQQTTDEYRAAIRELNEAREAYWDATRTLYVSLHGYGVGKLRLPVWLRDKFADCEAAEQRWHQAIDASVAAAERAHVAPLLTRDEDWHATVRAMARAEFGRSVRSDEGWQRVAEIVGETVRNVHHLTEQQQAQATQLYLETINALKTQRGANL